MTKVDVNKIMGLRTSKATALGRKVKASRKLPGKAQAMLRGASKVQLAKMRKEGQFVSTSTCRSAKMQQQELPVRRAGTYASRPTVSSLMLLVRLTQKRCRSNLPTDKRNPFWMVSQHKILLCWNFSVALPELLHALRDVVLQMPLQLTRR